MLLVRTRRGVPRDVGSLPRVRGVITGGSLVVRSFVVALSVCDTTDVNSEAVSVLVWKHCGVIRNYCGLVEIGVIFPDRSALCMRAMFSQVRFNVTSLRC